MKNFPFTKKALKIVGAGFVVVLTGVGVGEVLHLREKRKKTWEIIGQAAEEILNDSKEKIKED